ncbi:histidine kinase dimerization/phosphoacceptor domain -containing protein [Mucilaginibacter angelicae]|uniref:histidine kinase n=1 Tax=Mucilaginibacter angelicae TaxID=869718 RepID=A0ABV6L111_9SPHI
MRLSIHILFISLVFSFASAFAQTVSSLEQMRQKLALSKQDTAKAVLLIDLGRYYLNKPGELAKDMDSALLFSRQAKQLSLALDYDAGVGRSILLDGQVYRERGDRDLAWKTNEKALAFLVAHKMPYETGEAYRSAAAFFSVDDDDNLHKKIAYTEKAVALIGQAGNSLELAYTLQDLGDYYQINEEISKSISALEKALEVYKAVGYKQIQGVTNLLGYVYHLNGENMLALKYGLLAVKVAEEVHDDGMQLCTIYHRLAITYYVLKNYQLAFVYYTKAEAIAEKYKDAGAIQEIKFNLALLLKKLDNPKKALAELNGLVKRYPPTKKDQLITTNFLFANIYMDLKQYPRARYYIDSLDRLGKKFPAEVGRNTTLNKAPIRYFFETGQYRKAYKYLRLNDSITVLNHMHNARMENELYWSRTDSALGKYASALAHYKLYKTVSDSNKNEALRKQLNELQLQFDVEHKDQHIAMLTQQSQLQENRIRIESIYRKVFIGGLIILFSFLGLVYNRYLLKTRSNAIMEKKQSKINNQNELLRKLLQEKEWLVKEIHHRVKNNLQIVISLLNTQSAYLENEDALDAIKNSQHRMQTMSLIHQKLYQSENLSTIDMAVYIRELVAYLSDSFSSDKNVVMDLKVSAVKLDVSQAVPLGLILNEAISNSIKYAFKETKMGRIDIFLKPANDGRYLLCVTDNGPGLPEGFDPYNTGSLGMSLMQGLSQQLDGEFLLENKNGLRVCVTFKAIEFDNLENDIS